MSSDEGNELIRALEEDLEPPTVKETFDGAVERITEEAKETGKRIVEDLVGEAEPVLEAETVLEIALADDFNDALRETLKNGERLVKAQAAQAVENLRAVNEEAAREGILILEDLSRVGLALADAQIGPETAQQATDNFLAALQLIASRVTVESQKEAYRRAEASLASLRNVMFSLLQAGISAAVPEVKPLMTALASLSGDEV